MTFKKLLLAAAAIAGLVASATLPHDASAQVGAQILALTDAYNASGWELFSSLSESPGNIVLSPYSIGSAMSMTLSGARGDTAQEMASVLKHSLSREEIDAANGQVPATLSSYDRSAVPPACPAGMQLTGGRCEANPDANGWCPFSTRREGDRCRGGATFPPSAELLVANALMLLNSPSVSADYAGLLKDKYAAEVFRNASLADVNGWVARKTNGKIDKILDEAKADATSAVILSAVYFKSRWATPFDERRAQAEPFYISGTEQVMVSMMHQTGHYALVARQGYRAIRLPYVIQSLALVVVLPNEIDGLNDVMRGIDAKEQSALLAAYRSDPPLARAVLTLPRFKIESDIDLVPQFRKAAMQLAFDGNRADFSGMTGSPPSSPRLVIGKIRHRATIEVAEESTEAAAVTAVEMRPGGAAAPPPGPPPEDFRVDHPFLFYLADNATGAVLFAGRVASPPQLAGPVALQTQTALPPVSVGPMQSQRPSQGATQRPAPLPPTVVAPTPKSRPQ